MPILADVEFSSESLVILTALVGTLWGSLVFVWKRTDEEKNARIRLLEEQRAALVEQLVSRGLIDQAREAIDAPHRPKRKAI